MDNRSSCCPAAPIDTAYLPPELDLLTHAYRLIYYDQRGRGKSAEGVDPEEVTFASDLADLDAIRAHVHVDAPVLLGHSWGAILALEYALRNPSRVSRLIVMNPAPVSASQLAVLRKSYVGQLASDMERQGEIMATAAYKAGDPEAVAARDRIHFKRGLRRAADYEKLMARMWAQFRAQGTNGILKARAIESRLYRDTWDVADYDLLPTLPFAAHADGGDCGRARFHPARDRGTDCRCFAERGPRHHPGLRAFRLS